MDCLWSEWGPPSECSRTCGKGKRSVSRYIAVYPQNDGTPCPGEATSIQPCDDIEECAVKGK